jgi:DNA-binding MarR family transcriptional regulator
MRERARPWSLVSNHGAVLMAIVADPNARLRDVAQQTDITERAVFQLIDDLVHAGFIHRERVGRRNRYTLLAEQAVEPGGDATIGELMEALGLYVAGDEPSP